MILGSHNSWSYLSPKSKIARLFSYIGKCQNKDIYFLYEECNVRCFDLRIKFDKKGTPLVVHNNIEYNISLKELFEQLEWLNSKGDVAIRILHDVRKSKEHTPKKVELFSTYCKKLLVKFPKIKFWCGRNLVDWGIDYFFGEEMACIEDHASISKPKYVDDWLPWIYAKINNKKLRKKYKDTSTILLIDFVNI